MIHPGHPTLFFIGITQPQGCICPLSDLQARLAANHVAGRWPMPENVRELAEDECREIEKDFLHTKRHSLEVHFHPFLTKSGGRFLKMRRSGLPGLPAFEQQHQQPRRAYRR
ncbi:MAG: hypothetical protein H6559_21615 [Lewinellaceae bacterium]|nr:hypothetical protein [Lewinellaceae bacterium]